MGGILEKTVELIKKEGGEMGTKMSPNPRETDLLGLAFIENVLNGLYPYAQAWDPLGLGNPICAGTYISAVRIFEITLIFIVLFE